MSVVYGQLAAKQAAAKIMAAAGKRQYEYDSDEETEGGNSWLVYSIGILYILPGFRIFLPFHILNLSLYTYFFLILLFLLFPPFFLSFSQILPLTFKSLFFSPIYYVPYLL